MRKLNLGIFWLCTFIITFLISSSRLTSLNNLKHGVWDVIKLVSSGNPMNKIHQLFYETGKVGHSYFLVYSTSSVVAFVVSSVALILLIFIVKKFGKEREVIMDDFEIVKEQQKLSDAKEKKAQRKENIMKMLFGNDEEIIFNEKQKKKAITIEKLKDNPVLFCSLVFGFFTISIMTLLTQFTKYPLWKMAVALFQLGGKRWWDRVQHFNLQYYIVLFSISFLVGLYFTWRLYTAKTPKYTIRKFHSGSEIHMDYKKGRKHANKIVNKIEKETGKKGVRVSEGIRIPASLESKHQAYVASTGGGKTEQFAWSVLDFVSKGSRLLMLNNKGWASRLYGRFGSIIIGPQDERSKVWLWGKDVRNVDEATDLIMKFIDEKAASGSNKFFIKDAPVAIFSGIMMYCIQEHGEKWSAYQVAKYTRNEETIRECLEAIGDEQALAYISKDAKGQAASVLASCFTLSRLFERIGNGWRNYDDDNVFSIREWIHDDNTEHKIVILQRTPNLKDICDPLITAFYAMAFDEQMSLGDGELKHRIVYGMDEFAVLNKMDGFVEALTNLRSKNGIFILAFQHWSQLRDTYGEDLLKVIRDQFGVFWAGKTNDAIYADEICPMFGSAKTTKGYIARNNQEVQKKNGVEQKLVYELEWESHVDDGSILKADDLTSIRDAGTAKYSEGFMKIDEVGVIKVRSGLHPLIHRENPPADLIKKDLSQNTIKQEDEEEKVEKVAVAMGNVMAGFMADLEKQDEIDDDDGEVESVEDIKAARKKEEEKSSDEPESEDDDSYDEEEQEQGEEPDEEDKGDSDGKGEQVVVDEGIFEEDLLNDIHEESVLDDFEKLEEEERSY